MRYVEQRSVEAARLAQRSLAAVGRVFPHPVKCHADNTPDFSFVPRVVDDTNNRLDFDPNNSSYHPVIAIGKNANIPSIPSSLAPALNPFASIYCSSCHADDDAVSNGPHGSNFAPILRERYETADGTPENYDSYALCYRCWPGAPACGHVRGVEPTYRDSRQ